MILANLDAWAWAIYEFSFKNELPLNPTCCVPTALQTLLNWASRFLLKSAKSCALLPIPCCRLALLNWLPRWKYWLLLMPIVYRVSSVEQCWNECSNIEEYTFHFCWLSLITSKQKKKYNDVKPMGFSTKLNRIYLGKTRCLFSWLKSTKKA